MANGTPESEFSIECFQNYSAGEVFVQGLAGVVDQTDVETLIRAQKTMLQRFEKTTEMLTNCNALSANRLKIASQEFKKHTQLLLDMKKDLEYIFKKIRAIKTKLSAQYPEAYKVAVAASFANRKPLDEEEEEEKPPPEGEPRMVPTVSTETLKPISASDEKKTKRRSELGVGSEQKVEKQHSSSSDTEGEDSSADSSTDTG